MKKIGIVTLNGYFNYGNRLQNYAVQKTLESYGYYVETIIVQNKKNTSSGNKIKGKSIKEILKKGIRKVYFVIYKNKINDLKKSRMEIFKDFTKEFINETKFTISDNNIPNALAESYDFFVTGSDQVWNPDYILGSSVYFLTFAPKEKRVSLSPSFGISQIPTQYVETYKKWLNDMEYLSVREEAGAKIIKNLTGKEALVLLDPTMLLTKEQWMSISSKPKNIDNKKYLLTYFLGGITEEYRKKIKEISKQHNLSVINMADMKDAETYKTGPSEFIEYINSASVFCTDSFHGVVFSILLETPFIVFERKGKSQSMYSRLDTLLGKFNLESRKAENVLKTNTALNIDFSHVHDILECERNKANNYLKSIFEDKGAY